MSGSTISSYVLGPITTGIGGSYSSPLTIASTGTVAGNITAFHDLDLVLAGTVTGHVVVSAPTSGHLTLYPGYSFGGVQGWALVVPAGPLTADLAGTSPGTLSSLVTVVNDLKNNSSPLFNIFTIDAGADWTLTGNSDFAAYRNTPKLPSSVTVAGTLTNLGSLVAFNGVLVEQGGVFNNSGVVARPSAYTPVYLQPGAEFNNSGTLLSSGYGVLAQMYGLTNAAPVTVTNSGTISSTHVDNPTGIAIFGGNNNLVVNSGTITAPPGYRSAIIVGWGNITNTASGRIAGYVSAHSGTFTNFGSVVGQAIVEAQTIYNGGFIDDSSKHLAAAAIYVGNSGTIIAKWGTPPTNYSNNYYYQNIAVSSRTLVNSGYIYGAHFGVRGSEGLLSNSGTIGGRQLGVYLYPGATLINAGRISGARGIAVSFGGGRYGASSGYTAGSRLILEPGYSFGGAVTAFGTGNIVELGSAASAGTLSLPLQTEFRDFGSFVIDAGGTWRLPAGYTVPNGLGISVAGTLSDVGGLTNAGAITGYGAMAGSLIVDPAPLTNSGSIGIGVTLDGGSYLDNTGSGIVGVAGIAVCGSNGASTVVNAGTIAGTGTGGVGVSLASGGSVSNSGSGTISGTRYGIKAGGAAVTITNFGTIAGGIGIDVANAAATVENAGFVGGTIDAVSFGAGFADRLIIDPGASFSGTVDGGALSTSTLELMSGGAGTLSGLGSRYVDFSQLTLDAGATWLLTGSNTLGAGTTLSGPGTITLAAGATLDVAGSVASGATIAFGGSGAELVVESNAGMAGAVTGLVPGETIDLRGVDPGSVSYAARMLCYTAPAAGGTAFPLTLGSGGGIQAVSDGASGADVTALCFCAGTMLATPGGEVPVERLAVGDTVLTASGTPRAIIWIGIGRVLAARGRRSAATPVTVRKGALAGNVPHHDLRVTKGHAFWFDGVLIPVEFLVNHRSILWDDRAQEVALYHVELDRHDVQLANGAPAESYRDDGNRWLFRNANSGWDLPPLPPCAPVLTGGPVVDAVWQRLLARAGPRPGVPLTDDPDLHLLVDGTRVDAIERRKGQYVFRLSVRPRAVRIRSRTGVPQELGIARDARPLGVALRRIVLARPSWHRVTEAESSSLSDGYHAFEPDNGIRWTDGDAAIPRALFADLTGPCMLMLHLGCATHHLDDGNAARAA